jgi:hypothetical protein
VDVPIARGERGLERQRTQAEWALYRCQVGDFDRGLAELERLLRRDLIPLP